MTGPARENGESVPARRDAIGEIGRLSQQLDELIASMSFGSWPRLRVAFDDTVTPFAGIEETDDMFVVGIELPGVKRDEVGIEIAGRRLTVRAERKERERTGVLRRKTRTVGTFEYDVTCLRM